MGKIINGDCIKILRKLPENSVDSVVTDPPYGISFMNKSWDSFTPKSYQQFSYEWAKEVLRVLKPGGFLLAFSGTRTYHRMVCGIEDAGFIIRDQLDWLYGSGFPKGLNVAKAIDNHKGLKGKKGEKNPAYRKNYNKHDLLWKIPERPKYKTLPACDESLKWYGWNTNLKPAHEPIVMAQKPKEGTTVENILKWGVGAINIDACRIDYQNEKDKNNSCKTRPNDANHNKNRNVFDSMDKTSHSERGNPKGRYPSNLIIDEKAGEMIDEQSGNTGISFRKNGSKRKEGSLVYIGDFGVERNGIPYNDSGGASRYFKQVEGRYPSNVVIDESVSPLLDEQFSESKGGKFKMNNEINRKPLNDDLQVFSGKNCGFTFDKDKLTSVACFGDSGGVSRYFKRFFYNPKVDAFERNAGLNELNTKTIVDTGRKKQADYPSNRGKTKRKNTIATLKPINVMRYFINMVTPHKGVVLDPFAGSGTTGCACVVEGFDFILIEKREEFAKEIIPLRIKYWKNPKNWNKLKQHNELETKQYKLKTKSLRNL
jgi:site-specific DNA-methyltransferase (adenine-specific)